jgi:AraC-like DNA-binding protein
VPFVLTSWTFSRGPWHNQRVSSNARTVPSSTDPLGETLHLLRFTGTLYCRAELSAPWGVLVPALPGHMTFLIVMSGHAWLEVDGEPPRRLEPGSLTLVPHGTSHRVRSAPDVTLTPLFDIPVEHVSERYEIMRYGGGGERTHITYGVVRVDEVATQRLVSLLPAVLHIATWSDDANVWLSSSLRFIASEASARRPGGETVITRLADILVIQAIRSWIDAAPEAQHGWIAALRDPHLGRALAAIHRAPGSPWTLETLAHEAAMSRSVFSARFTAVVGEPAMQYLTRLRMQVAHERARATDEPLAALASHVGYQSEAAFCRAFKRMFGVSPGSVRKAQS